MLTSGLCTDLFMGECTPTYPEEGKGEGKGGGCILHTLEGNQEARSSM